MARIIIDKAALEAGEPAIQVVELSGERTNYRWVKLYGALGHSVADIRQYDHPQQDGTRIEIEAYNYEGMDA